MPMMPCLATVINQATAALPIESLHRLHHLWVILTIEARLSGSLLLVGLTFCQSILRDKDDVRSIIRCSILILQNKERICSIHLFANLILKQTCNTTMNISANRNIHTAERILKRYLFERNSSPPVKVKKLFRSVISSKR